MAHDREFDPPQGAFTHLFDVPASDVDDLGHAGNVSWVRWVSEVATAHSQAVGLDLAAYRELGVLWVVRRHEIDYLGSAFGGDTIVATTWVVDNRGASSRRRTLFRRLADGQVLGRATTTWALIGAGDGRPARIPKGLLERYGFVKTGA
jgi:acyl-CoA thioester hydrolase